MFDFNLFTQSNFVINKATNKTYWIWGYFSRKLKNVYNKSVRPVGIMVVVWGVIIILRVYKFKKKKMVGTRVCVGIFQLSGLPKSFSASA